MRVVILGSGVVGVASAWYLSQAGHEVTVIDRQPGPAEETSAANAGQISPGYAAPWAAPGVPLKAIKWVCQNIHQLHTFLNKLINGDSFKRFAAVWTEFRDTVGKIHNFVTFAATHL